MFSGIKSIVERVTNNLSIQVRSFFKLNCLQEGCSISFKVCVDNSLLFLAHDHEDQRRSHKVSKSPRCQQVVLQRTEVRKYLFWSDHNAIYTTGKVIVIFTRSIICQRKSPQSHPPPPFFRNSFYMFSRI